MMFCLSEGERYVPLSCVAVCWSGTALRMTSISVFVVPATSTVCRSARRK